MTHAEWVARFKEAATLSMQDPARASSLLLELAEEAERSRDEGLSEWHEHQAVGTAALFLEKAGQLDEALKLNQRVLDLCRGAAAYWTRAATHLLAVIALLHFKRGNDVDGGRVAYEALRSLGREPEMDTVLLDMMKELDKRRPQVGTTEGKDADLPESTE